MGKALVICGAEGASAGALSHRYVRGLEALPCAIGHVRRATRARLRLWGLEGVEEPVALALTEMLANVPKHTGSAHCLLTLEVAGNVVRLSVSDSSTDPPVLVRGDWTAESGRGLLLIAALATSFGCTVTEAGKDVWAYFLDQADQTNA